MKKTLQSYSSSATVGATSKNFLIPTWSQLVLYLLISLLLLTVFNLRQLWEYLNNNILASDGLGLGSVISENASGLHKLLNSLSQSIILQVAFWVCIGSLIYMLIWFVRNVVINILNDVVADSYVHPSSYSRFHYWESIIARKIFFGISLTVLLFYFFAGWRLMSSLAELAYQLFPQFTTPQNLLELTGAVLVTMALVHSFILITHITINSWRFIYRDL
jgi:hypothetical protein